MRPSIIVALGLAPIAALAETGPWFNYCGSNSLDNSALIASCTNGQTSIDLNGGIGNNNGQLISNLNGGYFGSCAKNGGNCDLQFDVLQCDCLSGDGVNHRSSLATSAHLYYNTATNSLFWSGL